MDWVRPNHLFGHNFDHDYDFELPCGSGAPNQFDGDVLHTMRQLRVTTRALFSGHGFGHLLDDEDEGFFVIERGRDSSAGHGASYADAFFL